MVAQLYPRALDSHGSVPDRLKSKSKLYYYRLSVGQSVLVLGTHLEAATKFSPPLFKYFWTVVGLLMWGALSDEKSGL
jgi:hypothetical protein